MKLNRTYYVWIDPMSGHIWNDDLWTSKKIAEAWIAPHLNLAYLKLKKIKIVEIRPEKK